MCVTFKRQTALHEELSCYWDKYSQMGSGIFRKTVVTSESYAASGNATWNSVTQGDGHTSVLYRNASEFSGPEFISDGPKDSRNVGCGQMSSCFSLFLGEKNGCRVLRAKGEMVYPDFTGKGAKNICHGVGASVPTAWGTCIHVKVPFDPEAYIWFIATYAAIKATWKKNSIWLFQQDNVKPHSACTTTGWLRSQSACTWLACQKSRSVSYWKYMVCHEEEYWDNGDQGLLSSLSYIVSSYNGEKFHLLNCNN